MTHEKSQAVFRIGTLLHGSARNPRAHDRQLGEEDGVVLYKIWGLPVTTHTSESERSRLRMILFSRPYLTLG